MPRRTIREVNPKEFTDVSDVVKNILDSLGETINSAQATIGSATKSYEIMLTAKDPIDKATTEINQAVDQWNDPGSQARAKEKGERVYASTKAQLTSTLGQLKVFIASMKNLPEQFKKKIMDSAIAPINSAITSVEASRDLLAKAFEQYLTNLDILKTLVKSSS
jgi:hypothetical protein